MPTLRSSDVLNAPAGDAVISVPNGGIFILKQLLADWLTWDVADQGQRDTLDAILAATIRLKQVAIPQVEVGLFVTKSSQEVYPSLVETNIDFSGPDVLNTEIIDYEPQGRIYTFQRSGYYLITGFIRVNNQNTPAGDFLHRLYFKRNGNNLAVSEGHRLDTDWASLSFAFTRYFADGDLMTVSYWHDLSPNIDVFLQNGQTQLQVVTLG